MTRVTIDDMRRAKVCPGNAKCRGARDWFRDNGLNWRAFVRDGIDAEELLKPELANSDVLRVIEMARKREANGR